MQVGRMFWAVVVETIGQLDDMCANGGETWQQEENKTEHKKHGPNYTNDKHKNTVKSIGNNGKKQLKTRWNGYKC